MTYRDHLISALQSLKGLTATQAAYIIDANPGTLAYAERNQRAPMIIALHMYKRFYA